jgi:hypothetical protein
MWNTFADMATLGAIWKNPNKNWTERITRISRAFEDLETVRSRNRVRRGRRMEMGNFHTSDIP